MHMFMHVQSVPDSKITHDNNDVVLDSGMGGVH